MLLGIQNLETNAVKLVTTIKEKDNHIAELEMVVENLKTVKPTPPTTRRAKK